MRVIKFLVLCKKRISKWTVVASMSSQGFIEGREPSDAAVRKGSPRILLLKICKVAKYDWSLSEK